MSLSPARNKYLNPSSSNPYPTLLEFYNSLNKEWEFVMKDVNEGMMKGITLVPSKNSASDWISKVTSTMAQVRQNLKKAKKRGSRTSEIQDAAALPRSLFGFELFLLGGDSEDDSDDEQNDGDAQQNINNNNIKSSVVSSASSGVASQLTSNLLRTIASSNPLTFSGFVTVNSKNSPWYGGCFEFQLQVFLGYPDHSCPALYFTQQLSHPELRGGKQLPIVSELFASTKRIKNPFMFRDILDSVRELFVQPVPMFSSDVVQRAALDVKFRSVTSAYFEREDLFELDSFVLQENMELLKREISASSSSTSSSAPNSLHGVFSNLNPAARFLAQQERESSTRSKMSELEGFSSSAKNINNNNNSSNKTDDNDNDGFDDALENNDNDLEPYFLHSNLGVILSEAHVPFLVQRSNNEAEKSLINENKNSKNTSSNKNQSQKSTSSHEQQLEEESRNATRWIGRTSSSSSSSSNSNQQPNFDKWLNRRLMRTFLPQVASVAEE